jgi:glycosyltransferase involved in cell wall biosynthesis
MSLDMGDKKTIVVLGRGPIFSVDTINSGKYSLLSEEFDGLVFHQLETPDLRGQYMGGFLIDGVVIPKFINKFGLLSHGYYFLIVLFKILIRRDEFSKIDFVIATNPFLVCFLAILVRAFKGSKFILELNGNYASDYNWEMGTATGRLKKAFGLFLTRQFVKLADGVKTLYPEQINDLAPELETGSKVHSFHEFVPVSGLKASDEDQGYVAFLGFPWYLKGVDLLIKAFRKCDIPESYRLRIVGFFSDEERARSAELAEGDARISIEPPVNYSDAQEFIKACSFLVLPSRTEGMGRVLLEAMAHKKSVIGAGVDGIPSVVKHNETGLLFKAEDVADLRECIERLVNEPGLRERLSSKGYKFVHEQLSEKVYLRKYKALLHSSETG